MTHNPIQFTPESLSMSDIIFSIPLYQRLFEWEDTQILQLLTDLKNSFIKNSTEPYYIGMLTAYKQKRNDNKTYYDLVDGQQRLTVLMLLGIVLKWDKFLTPQIQDEIRLSIFARPKDRVYLKNKIIGNKNVSDYKNVKMESGIACIEKFFKDVIIDITGFQKYIFEHLTFFISYLPDTYELHDLNRYFESMNATGRSLENHEILKVTLLRKLTGGLTKDDATHIWNAVSEMNKLILPQKENQNNAEYKSQYKKLLQSDDIKSKLEALRTNTAWKESEPTKSVGLINASSEKPSSKPQSSSSFSIISFSEFLLHVLALEFNKDSEIPDFFNVHKLQETFKRAFEKLGNERISSFFKNLLKYRLILDYFIIRVNNQNQLNEKDLMYVLEFEHNDLDKSSKEQLIKFQSMLYVSSYSYSHVWLIGAFKFLGIKENLNISAEDFLLELKKIDNENHKAISELKYRSIDRYWFWRLDYYLWERRDEFFKNKEKDVADNYIFRVSRSIEHIAPQNPKQDSKFKNIIHLDDFGNLAMIPNGLNSQLSNSSFEIKKAEVQSFINKSKMGSIPSLKLLAAYSYEHWNDSAIIEHGDEMIDILIKSFPGSEYEDVRESLEKQKQS